MVDVRGLLEWAEAPRRDTGMRFLLPDRTWSFHPYTDVAARSRAAATFLLEQGLERNDVVALGLDTGIDFVAAFYGTLMAGGTPCTLPTLSLTQASAAFVDHVTEIVRAARPKVFLAGGGLEHLMDQACRAADVACRPIGLAAEEHAQLDDVRPPADLALLQFTSGSSGHPRGVMVTWDNLETNVAMIRRWLRTDHRHATASWLPLYHDMGLIGCMVTPTLNHSDVDLMTPMQFIERPLMWLGCFGVRGAHIGVAPTFAISHLLRVARRRHTAEKLEGMDFSSWKVFVLGAERVDPHALRSFAEWLAPLGFDAGTYMPAYGLAEGTLAISGVEFGEVPHMLAIRWDGTSPTNPLLVLAESSVDTAIDVEDGGWITSCGSPLHGVDVSIEDDDGTPLGPGQVGEIVVRGPNVGAGYAGGDDVGSSTFGGGALHTGDAGFTWSGQLYVIGRMGDSVKVNARSIFAEDLEARLGCLPGAQSGQFIVISGRIGRHGSAPSVALVVERGDDEWCARAVRLLQKEVGSGARIECIKVPRGSIQRTSSGKPRRRLMWRRLVEGELTGPEPDGEQGGAEDWSASA